MRSLIPPTESDVRGNVDAALVPGSHIYGNLNRGNTDRGEGASDAEPGPGQRQRGQGCRGEHCACLMSHKRQGL